MPSSLRNPVFDQLFDAAVPHVLNRTHQQDVPPVDGGRWPVTVVARPPSAVRDALEELMRDGITTAGAGHFVTGREDSVHLTVRALEPYRDAACPADDVVPLWRAAIERACAATAPLEFTVTGLTMSRVGVMAQVEPGDAAAWRFMDRLRDELGDLAWFEDQGIGRRTIWYATLIHFAADLADPAGLVDWVSARRTLEPMDFTVGEVELVRSRYVAGGGPGGAGDRLMRPESWFTVPFGR
ncbi:2'-5' RNA ligase family protein [Intrasporangium sp. DVR]|uniref:2'-5' RNA ligase family protein n=1 Tax=Intrasporangium sp. DVR TaxID=3127867 RepID=UPI00333EA55E